MAADPHLPSQQDDALETAQDLSDQGWPVDFRIGDGVITWDGRSEQSAPASEFKVWRQYRFEGQSDPADEVILLAVEHLPSADRGVIHAAFGPDATAEQARVFRDLAHHAPD
jgi:hypothetical protein